MKIPDTQTYVVLDSFYNLLEAEALKIIGRKDRASARYLQDLLSDEYPGIRFDWNEKKPEF